MNRKTLTVSIAAYNVSGTIEKALNSLLLDEMYMARLEIIIVNDGSTDNTLSIIKEYVENYPDSVRVIDKPNGGYGSTINASLAVARGKYYKLLDGDDWYDSGALCRLLDYLEDAEADLIVSPFREVGRRERVRTHLPEIPAQICDITLVPLGRDRLLQMPGLTVKTETLRRQYFPVTEHCFYTDTEFVYRCISSADTIVRFNESVYCYRNDFEGQSTSIKGIQAHYRDGRTVAKTLCRAFSHSTYSGSKRILLEEKVSLSIYWVFLSYLLLGRKYRKQLIQFDKEIREEYPLAYEVGRNSRIVRWMRNLRFGFYPLFRWYVMWKHWK